MTRTLNIHPAALAEAEAAAIYYAERSSKAAIAFTNELNAAIAEIERGPHRFPEYVWGTRRILLRMFPFSVIYRISEEEILIVAIAHGSRRPGYWSRRVRS